MAGSVNKVILVGNLGRDPEVRSTQDGRKIVNLNLATSDSWTDRASGERRERTEWHRVVIFNDKLGDVAERFLRKGSKVYLEGALQTRKWTDQSGQEKYTTEIVLQQYGGTLVLLDSRRDDAGAGAGGGGGHDEYDRGYDSAPAPRSAGSGRGSAGGASGGGARRPPADLDDEIPF